MVFGTCLVLYYRDSTLGLCQNIQNLLEVELPSRHTVSKEVQCSVTVISVILHKQKGVLILNKHPCLCHTIHVF